MGRRAIEQTVPWAGVSHFLERLGALGATAVLSGLAARGWCGKRRVCRGLMPARNFRMFVYCRAPVGIAHRHDLDPWENTRARQERRAFLGERHDCAFGWGCYYASFTSVGLGFVVRRAKNLVSPKRLHDAVMDVPARPSKGIGGSGEERNGTNNE